MKKIYNAPTTEIMETELVATLCKASKYTVNRYGQWGASETQSPYGNNAWQIEGYTGSAETAGEFTAVGMEDDNGELSSRANDGLW